MGRPGPAVCRLSRDGCRKPDKSPQAGTRTKFRDSGCTNGRSPARSGKPNCLDKWLNPSSLKGALLPTGETGLRKPDDLRLRIYLFGIAIFGHRAISVRFVKTIAFDLVGETNARKAKFVRRPALVPSVARQCLIEDLFLKIFNLVLQGCSVRDVSH